MSSIINKVQKAQGSRAARTAMGTAGYLTCQSVGLKVCSVHSNAAAPEMPFPKCLFPDEV